MAITIEMLPVFYKQRDNLFYPAVRPCSSKPYECSLYININIKRQVEFAVPSDVREQLSPVSHSVSEIRIASSQDKD